MNEPNAMDNIDKRNLRIVSRAIQIDGIRLDAEMTLAAIGVPAATIIAFLFWPPSPGLPLLTFRSLSSPLASREKESANSGLPLGLSGSGAETAAAVPALFASLARGHAPRTGRNVLPSSGGCRT